MPEPEPERRPEPEPRSAEPEALVCEVQRFSVHDGPGIRTTIFFKGCPLRCEWCHNPESLSFKNQPVYNVADCIACGDCADACKEQALQLKAKTIRFEPALCTGCLKCTEACPSRARRPAARTYNPPALLDAVLRDRDFYGETGGITLSGGEPLAQGRFLEQFLPLAKAADLHILAETAGHWSWKGVATVLRHIDEFYFDIKAADPARHEAITGRSNKLIVENLRRLLDEGHNVQVRMPLVVGRNADDENLEATAELLHSLKLKELTLVPYHSMGESKLGKVTNPLQRLGLRAPTSEELDAAAGFLRNRGIAALI